MDIASCGGKTTGAYTFAEAARILLATQPALGYGRGLGAVGGGKVCSRLRYWVNSGVVYDGLVKDTGRDRFIHFQALVSLRVVSLLWGLGVEVRAIRRGEQGLREALGVSWPFASETVWRREKWAFPKFAALIAESRNGAAAMGFLGEWLSENADGIRFDECGMAYAWLPARNIVLDGRIISGRPCIAWRRIWPAIIRDCLALGDSLQEMMEGYDLTEEQVFDALAWEKRIDAVAF